MKTPFEVLHIANDVRIGFLFVAVAELAYSLGDEVVFRRGSRRNKVDGEWRV
ncbi:MAG: hypothetical protein M3Y72_26910 [Acidobacteriota bacterium]|nr:hypothetical protein [Acidobacteriota bacterium]